jgi:hypothetical protein
MDSDTDQEYFTEEVLPLIISAAAQSSLNTEHIRSLLLPGKIYITELLATANPQRCKEVLHMRIETFYTLRNWLLAHTSLRGSRHKSGISIEEKIVIFSILPQMGLQIDSARKGLLMLHRQYTSKILIKFYLM